MQQTVLANESLKNVETEKNVNKKLQMQLNNNNQQFSQSSNNDKIKSMSNNNQDNQRVKEKWTKEEDKKMYQIHKQFGNKWAYIAKHIPNKSDNSIKNHFYSKIRKSFRRINKVINTTFIKQFKQLKMATIYKVIGLNQQRFKKGKIQSQLLEKSKVILEQLIEISQQSQDYQNQSQRIKIYNLIKRINSIDQKYLKNSKKKKNASQEEFLPRNTIRKRQKKEIKTSEDDQNEQNLEQVSFQDQFLIKEWKLYKINNKNQKNQIRMIEQNQENQNNIMNSFQQITNSILQQPKIKKNLSNTSKISGKEGCYQQNMDFIKQYGYLDDESIINDFLSKNSELLDKKDENKDI